MNGIRNRISRLPQKPYNIPQRVIDRVLKKVAKDPGTDCHLSTYSTGSHGYAQVGWNDGSGSRVTLAHRVAWIAKHGPIPDGMTIDHICKAKTCVNVEHLRMIDNYENGRRTAGRDWPMGQCANGHPASHLRLYGQGDRPPRLRCQTCNNIQQARHRRKKLGLAA